MIVKCQFKQLVSFETAKTGTLDLLFTNNEVCIINVEKDTNRMQNFSNHYPIKFEVPCVLPSSVKVISIYYSYCRCDYDGLKASLIQFPFKAYCYSNVDVNVACWYEWMFNHISQHTPRRTQKRQNFQPWVKPETSHYLNKVSSYKSFLRRKINPLEDQLPITVKQCKPMIGLCMKRT